jgi:hypothetical protein
MEKSNHLVIGTSTAVHDERGLLTATSVNQIIINKASSLYPV